MTEAILRDACRTVLETFARIRADGGADAFRALARSRVVSWRDDIRRGGPDPVPWAQERFGRPPGEFGPPPRDRDERVGLDADGTIVIHERPGPEGRGAVGPERRTSRGRGDHARATPGHGRAARPRRGRPGRPRRHHLAWDEALGFTFADGGNFQFRIPATALAKGDWSAVVATADSS